MTIQYSFRISIVATATIILLCVSFTNAQINTPVTVECTAPAPTPGFTCNNETGTWEIPQLTIGVDETITFSSWAEVKGDLDLLPGGTLIFNYYDLLWVGGTTTLSSNVYFNLGDSNEENDLWDEFTSKKKTNMPLIFGSNGFIVSGANFQVTYTGGCTSVKGGLSIIESGDTDYPLTLLASNLKKSGTGSCHWVWVTLSSVGAGLTLIIVPLLEKYVWKIYD